MATRPAGLSPPVLAIGDGELGFWSAVREVFPQARTQRCWFHKIANVLGALPKSAHPGAKKALAEIWNAEDKDHARTAVKAFAAAYGAKFPKAAAKITEDEDELLAFYDYPAEHWVHLRTTNPIESTFATVRLRTKVTKGHGSKAAALAMAFKLIESAQRRWRMVNAPHLVALVRAGAAFVNGKLVERPEDEAAEETKVEAALPVSALRDRAGMAAWHRADLGEAGGDAAPGPGLTVAAESAEAGLSRGGLSTPSRGRVPAPGAHTGQVILDRTSSRRHSIGPPTLPRSCQLVAGPVNRRSITCWTRRRSGLNSAATARVETATATGVWNGSTWVVKVTTPT